MSYDPGRVYDPEVHELLAFFEANPKGHWTDIPKSLDPWKRVILDDNLLADGITMEGWHDGLSDYGKIVLLKHRRGAQSVGKPAKQATKSRVSIDAQALGVFIENTGWTKKKIAKVLGRNEKSLCPKRCPKLAAAIAAHKSRIDPDRRRRRGSKDGDGNLEAWEEE